MKGDWFDQAREYSAVDRAAFHKATLNIARDAALAYAKKIRNAAKRNYARAYTEFRFADAPCPEPSEGLSFMGAQAVRHRMEDIYRAHFHEDRS